jgi:hypothetical protein
VVWEDGGSDPASYPIPAEETEVVHNKITFFQGNFIAGDLQFVHTGKLALTAQLQSIEALNPISGADFVRTLDAWPVPRRINISAGVAQGMLLKNTAPEFPPDAKFEGIQGTAVLQALIGIDGHIATCTLSVALRTSKRPP